MGTPFQPLPCAGDGGGSAAFTDVEQTILCDVDAGGERLATVIMVQAYDDTGTPVGVPTPHDPATGLPYLVQGTLVPCESAGADAELEVLCDLQADGSAIQFLRHYVHSSGTGELLPGETFDTLPDGSPYAPIGTVASCDPYRQCIPSSSQDLGGTCGPGEPAERTIILEDGQAPDSVVEDDPSADALCGGTWGPGPDPQTAPFPVDESFRNATFDQPGPVLQGSPPYAGLTASPGWTGSNVDPAGDGWLQTSDINSGTNGVWQVPAPFPTTQGATASITFTSHDGTAQGGDGLAFVFTDGGVAPQAAPIGGFGNLGLQNWSGGYVAIVLDEYGQTCTCDHTAPPGGPNAGPCGFCTNTISLQLAGTARQAASCACCTIAQAPLAPKQINGATRSAPGRLTVSIIEEAGQTFVSASILWPGDSEPTVYFNRVDVTACAGPAPSSLRMAVYGGSGGAFRSEHEFRDAQALAAGIQDWRSFPIETDPIPACVTQVAITAEVDVTFVSDTQTAGNANNEAWFWLVNIVTGTIVDRGEVSSLPSQVGTAHHLSISSGLIPVADLPNYRIYVGAETRDAAGDYGHLWENLDVTVSGAGCPVVPRRTLEISAVCPIPVTIVGGGGGDSEPAAPAVFNAPATFEDAPVCATVAGVQQPAFRREVRTPDGAIAFSFLGVDGVPIAPDTWAPGGCPGTDTELIDLCDRQANGVLIPFVRRMVFDADGAVIVAGDIDDSGNPYVPTGTVTICSGAGNDVEQVLLCDDAGSFLRTVLYASGQGGLPVFSADWALDGLTPYVPVGTVRACDGCSATVLGQVCVTSTDFPGQTLPAIAVQACDGTVTYLNASTGVAWPNTTGVVICPPPNVLLEEILCDNGTNPPVAFRRVYTLTALGSVVSQDEDFDATAYVLVGDAVNCSTGGTTVIQEMCDRINISTTTQFYRQLTFNAAGDLVTIAEFDSLGIPYVPVGEVRLGHCDPNQVEHEIMCDMPSGTQFLRVWRYSGFDTDPTGFNDYDLGGVAPYVVVGTAQICTASTGPRRDEELLVLCDATPTRFLRRYNYDGVTGALVSTVNTTLDGVTAFVPVGAVGVCTTAIASDFDFLSTVLCDSNGTQFIQRLTFNSATGAVTATTNTTLTGGAFVPVGAVGLCSSCCPIVLEDDLCTNVGSGRGVAIRNANGTISLLDAVTGAAIVAANIVACVTDPVETLQARIFNATAGTPWTPALVTGTITALSATGVSGTYTVTPPEGAAVTLLPAGFTSEWGAEDANTLQPPTSIAADAASRVVVVWTER